MAELAVTFNFFGKMSGFNYDNRSYAVGEEAPTDSALINSQ